ncbi:MAG: hypothetical protein IPG45_29055 [Deltaproteobacteria bacterium]|nr:hypothetical protein [Deltaproteobacteria bacterium]
MQERQIQRAAYLEICERAYYSEADRTGKINDSLTLPLGVVAVLLAAMVQFVDQGRFVKPGGLINEPLLAFFVALLFVGVAFQVVYLAKCAYHAYACAEGHKFKGMPTVGTWEKQRRVLEDYRRSNPGEPQTVDEMFVEDYVAQLAQACDVNTAANDQKSYLRHLCLLELAKAIAATAITSVPYVVLRYLFP